MVSERRKFIPSVYCPSFSTSSWSLILRLRWLLYILKNIIEFILASINIQFTPPLTVSLSLSLSLPVSFCLSLSHTFSLSLLSLSLTLSLSLRPLSLCRSLLRQSILSPFVNFSLPRYPFLCLSLSLSLIS